MSSADESALSYNEGQLRSLIQRNMRVLIALSCQKAVNTPIFSDCMHDTEVRLNIYARDNLRLCLRNDFHTIVREFTNMSADVLAAKTFKQVEPAEADALQKSHSAMDQGNHCTCTTYAIAYCIAQRLYYLYGSFYAITQEQIAFCIFSKCNSWQSINSQRLLQKVMECICEDDSLWVGNEHVRIQFEISWTELSTFQILLEEMQHRVPVLLMIYMPQLSAGDTHAVAANKVSNGVVQAVNSWGTHDPLLKIKAAEFAFALLVDVRIRNTSFETASGLVDTTPARIRAGYKTRLHTLGGPLPVTDAPAPVLDLQKAPAVQQVPPLSPPQVPQPPMSEKERKSLLNKTKTELSRRSKAFVQEAMRTVKRMIPKANSETSHCVKAHKRKICEVIDDHYATIVATHDAHRNAHSWPGTAVPGEGTVPQTKSKRHKLAAEMDSDGDVFYDCQESFDP